MAEKIRQTGLPYNDRAAKQLLMCRKGIINCILHATVMCGSPVFLQGDAFGRCNETYTSGKLGVFSVSKEE